MLQPHLSTAAACGKLVVVRQHSAQLVKPFMAAQRITEKEGGFKTSSRFWSTQASQEVLTRTGLVSANGGL